jgi:muramoyltetrapeptide carboxypeptidase
VCARGGYGANYLLEAVDWEKIKAHPKIFVGYSDLTSLLTHLCDRAGWVTFHGPMVAKDWAQADGVDRESWLSALSGSPWELKLGAESGVVGLVDGSAKGVLSGGCLSILVASLGTSYEVKTAGRILFLEDVAAKPFQIDRMLMQFRLAGKFKGVRGIIFGAMKDCVQNSHQAYSLPEVVLRIVGGLGVPVAYGLRSGHVAAGNITLPFGVRAGLEVRDGTVRLRMGAAVV